MPKKTLLRVAVIGLLLLATTLVSVSCSTTKGSNQNAENEKLKKLRATKLYKEKNIEIGDNYFAPKETTVKPGTIVIFENRGISLHDVMGDDAKTLKIIDSDDLGQGEKYVVLLEKEGEYGYYCHFHGGPKRGQYGIITVKP